MAPVDVRKGMPPVKLPREEFEKRYRSRFVDPAFRPLQRELDAIIAAAWDGYSNSRKAPVTRTESADPGILPSDGVPIIPADRSPRVCRSPPCCSSAAPSHLELAEPRRAPRQPEGRSSAASSCTYCVHRTARSPSRSTKPAAAPIAVRTEPVATLAGEPR